MQSLSVLILSSLTLAAAWQQSSTCILGGDACPTGSSCTPTQTCGYVSLNDPVSGLMLSFEPPDKLLVAGDPLFTLFNKIYRITCLRVEDSILTLTMTNSGLCFTPTTLPPAIPCTVGNNGPCPTNSICTPTMICPTSAPCGGRTYVSHSICPEILSSQASV